jgi:hypothetical protein
MPEPIQAHAALPIDQALITLKALQDAVTKNLEFKKKLGHYVVIWQDGKPVRIGADVPPTEDI